MKTSASPFFLAINQKRKPDILSGKTSGEECRFSWKFTKSLCEKRAISRLMATEITANYVESLKLLLNRLIWASAQNFLAVEHRHKNDAVLIESNTNVTSIQKERRQVPTSIWWGVYISGLFAGSKIKSIEGCTFNYSFNHAPGSAVAIDKKIHRKLWCHNHEHVTLWFHLTQVQIKAVQHFSSDCGFCGV